MKPDVVELLVAMGVGGYGWFITMMRYLIETASLAFWKTPLVSASAAEEITFLKVLHSIWMETVWRSQWILSALVYSIT